MTHVWREEEGGVRSLGPEAWAKGKERLAKQQYRDESIDTDIKLNRGVSTRAPDADPRDTADVYADEMGL